jgi:hypothetical protein
VLTRTLRETSASRSLGEVLSTEQTAALDPPTSAPTGLPIGQLESAMVERLVAEVAMRVDGTPHVRLHGRSGQKQAGLDLWGGAAGNRSVYQVRRITQLTALALRAAVVDYAGPLHTGTRTSAWTERRFVARRFVLVTGCTVNDVHVDQELDKLQREYADDLKIELWDNGELSRMLRDRGPLVAGIFGETRARVRV